MVVSDGIDEQIRRIASSIRLLGWEGDLLGTEAEPELSDITLEQHALVSMIGLADCIRDHVAAGVQARDFVVPAHMLLYATILDLWDRGAPVNWGTLHHALFGKPTYEEIGGDTWLAALIEGCTVVSLLHGPTWAPLIHEMASMRVIAGVGPVLEKAVLSAPDLAEAVSRAQDILARSMEQVGVAVTATHPADILRDADRREAGWATPWQSLTWYTGGLATRQVWSVIGTSSHGKTALMLNMLHLILVNGGNFAYFNLDSASFNLMHRLIALEGTRAWPAGVSRAVAGSSQPLATEEGKAAWAARSRLTGEWAERYRVYGDIRDLARILSEARRHKAQHGLDVLAVDFIQNVTIPGADEYERVNRVMTAFQQFAQVENCSVVLLSQTAIEQQKGQRVTDATNAKGSGAVKDASDVALVVYRDRFSEDRETQRHMEVTVLKSKEGPTGRLALEMDFRTGRITQREARFQSVDYQDWLASL